jgi:deoxyribodipyrimidine photolyase
MQPTATVGHLVRLQTPPTRMAGECQLVVLNGCLRLKDNAALQSANGAGGPIALAFVRNSARHGVEADGWEEGFLDGTKEQLEGLGGALAVFEATDSFSSAFKVSLATCPHTLPSTP